MTRNLTISMPAGTTDRHVTLEHNYLRGWLIVSAAGEVVAYELDATVASLAERAGRAAARNLPGLHRAYVRGATKFRAVFGDAAATVASSS